MSTPDRPTPDDSVQAFERAADKPASGFLAELWDFLRHNKKWWLTPIVIALLLVGVIVVLGSSPILAPFIYPAW